MASGSSGTRYLTRLPSDPIGTLEGLSEEEIGVGLWSVLDSGRPGTALAVNDATRSLDARIACVHQIRTLYEELFVPRCAERLGHLSEQRGRLEMICYMFWDVAVFGGPPGEREGDLFEDSVLDVLGDTLYLEHAACQESAVHGLGHRMSRHPQRARRCSTGGSGRGRSATRVCGLRRGRPDRLHQ